MKIGVFGGGFKPFTTGHFSKLALAMQDNDQVILYYGIAARKERIFDFTEKMARDIHKIVKNAIERTFSEKVKVELGLPTPVVKMFGLIEAIKDNKDNSVISLNKLSIDPSKVESLTIYADQDDIKRFSDYIGTEKELKYFGNMIKENRLSFDAGMLNNSNDRLIDAMKKYYSKMSNDEIVELINIRGTDVRGYIASKSQETVMKFLPSFLTNDEKFKIMTILHNSLLDARFKDIDMYIKSLESTHK